MTKIKLILPATWNQYLLFIGTSHLTIHQSPNSACRLHLTHTAFLWGPPRAPLALKRSFYHYYTLICSNFPEAYNFETCKPIALTDTRVFLQAYMDSGGMHFFTSQTFLEGKAELCNLCAGPKSKLAPTWYEDGWSADSCSYWGHSRRCNKTVPCHLKKRNNVPQPRSQYTWKPEITTHLWWCDSLPDGQGKDSKAKRGAMNALRISQKHGNRLGMLGETAQPVSNHIPHDRSYINPFHLRKEMERCIFTPMQS